MRATLLVSLCLCASSLAQRAPEPPQPPPPPPPLTTSEVECFPACRKGFVCSLGECISRCNPPCEAGNVCTESGECIPPPPPAPSLTAPARVEPYAPSQYTPPPPAPYVPQPSQRYAAPSSERAATRSGLRVTTGWATGGAVYGIVTMGVTAVMTGVVAALSGTPGSIAGAITTLFLEKKKG